MARSARRRTHWTVALAVALLVAGLLTASTSPVAAAATLLSQGKPTTASSTENTGTPASAAVDGNTVTRWSSAFSDPQWLQVDLGSTQSISQVVLQWEAAYATAFQLQTSADGTNWTTIYSTTTGTGGTQTLAVTGSGRYVRLYGTARATQYGYSLWEFQIYGGGAASCGTTDTAVGKLATASSTENASFPAADTVDGDPGTRWSSAAADPQWLQVDLGSTQTVCGIGLSWETAYGKSFQLQTSADATNWTTIYSTTAGAGGNQSLTVSGSGRYVRLYGTARGTQYGYSLWTFSIFTPGTGGGTGGNGNCPWVGSTAPIATRVSQLLAQMTQAQKLTLLHGNGNSSPYIGNTDAIPSLCVPAMGFEDGPNGVGDGLGNVTQLPVAVSAASTFDNTLEQQYGSTLGAEFAGKGADVALGPTLNIDRDPRWGRAFETFSEDPYLNGQMAAADIKGIQSQGVMAQPKHVAVYNQETNRNGPADNAIIDAKTLQEIYLPAFQTAVTQGAAASAMCAYSTVNGVYACQNAALLNSALYQQAGFGGFVTSDWGGTHSTVDSANNGMTMEMPNGYFYADFLNQALANGQVSQATLNTMVSRVLTQMFAFGLFDKTKTGTTSANVSTAAHIATAKQVAQEGTVLLKNTGILPLNSTTLHSIAVLGYDGGAGVHTSGGGSGNATSSGTVWPITGIQNRAGSGVNVQYEAAPDDAGIARAVTLAKNSDVAVVFADNPEQEGTDLANIDLPGNQNSLISQVAAANPKTTVVVDSGSAVTMPWLGQVQGVLEEWYAGQEVGDSLASLLFGDVNPSGKLPVTFPNSLNDVPAHTTAQWPGANNQVQYSEGVDVGYRWYDAKNITPMFPFGFGLSYTSFAFSNLAVGALGSNNTATVTATVKNTGTRQGSDVVQLYVGQPSANGEAPHQLRNYARVSLAPGASQSVSFTVSAHDLAHWDTTNSRWTTTAGAYQILVGDSSRNLPLTGTINVASMITNAAAMNSSTVTIDNPHGMSSRLGASVSLPISSNGAIYSAQGLPAGLSISPSGVISGRATARGTSTVTVTATNTTGSSGQAIFVWTIS